MYTLFILLFFWTCILVILVIRFVNSYKKCVPICYFLQKDVYRFVMCADLLTESPLTPIVVKNMFNFVSSMLGENLATKSGDMYSEVTRLIRVKLSFIILKSALQCIRSSRTVYGDHLTTCDDFSHSLNEMRLNTDSGL